MAVNIELNFCWTFRCIIWKYKMLKIANMRPAVQPCSVAACTILFSPGLFTRSVNRTISWCLLQMRISFLTISWSDCPDIVQSSRVKEAVESYRTEKIQYGSRSVRSHAARFQPHLMPERLTWKESVWVGLELSSEWEGHCMAPMHPDGNL